MSSNLMSTAFDTVIITAAATVSSSTLIPSAASTDTHVTIPTSITLEIVVEGSERVEVEIGPHDILERGEHDSNTLYGNEGNKNPDKNYRNSPRDMGLVSAYAGGREFSEILGRGDNGTGPIDAADKGGGRGWKSAGCGGCSGGKSDAASIGGGFLSVKKLAVVTLTIAALAGGLL